MTAPLDPSIKRLRALKDSDLVDEVGALKAEISDREAKLGELKDEAIRRKLSAANGSLFRITLSPPGQRTKIDKPLLERVFGAAFIEHFSKTESVDWIMRCFARKAEPDKAAA